MEPLLTIITLLLVARAPTLNAEPPCEVRGLYRSVRFERGTLVKTRRGDTEEAELILVPTRLERGNYTLTVTRRSDNLYEEETSNLWLVTRYCYEYAYSQGAVLRWMTPSARGLGTLTFER